jgi:hypothetical protein
LEILLLGQQLTSLQRRGNQPVRAARIETRTLGVLATKRKAVTQQPTAQLREVVRWFQPETVLKWQRERVRRTWR